MKKCIKCLNKLEENIKFCEKCGKKVEKESGKKIKIKNEQIENKKINDIKNHIEFLGYATEFKKSNTSVGFLIGMHQNKPNLIINFSAEDFTFFSTTWNGLKKVTDIKQYKLINDLMGKSDLCQFFIDETGSLKVYGTYIGEYSKKTFSNFLEVYFNDNNRFLNNEEFQKLFIK